jgi:hypothetical protein
MQECQMHTSIPIRGYLILLHPSLHMYRCGETVGGGCPAVPVPPGHVRLLHPYPSSRRRRR